MGKVLLTLLAVASLAVPGYAGAQQYLGLTGGVSKSSNLSSDLGEQLTLLGYQAQEQKTDKTDKAYRVFVGHRFSKNVAVEVGFGELGKVNFSVPVLSEGGLNVSRETRFADISVVGTVPITPAAELFARLGAQRSEVSASYTGEGSVRIFDSQARQEQKQTKAVAAMGLHWNLSNDIKLRFEASRSNKIGSDLTLGQASVTAYSAGILIQFADLFSTR